MNTPHSEEPLPQEGHVSIGLHLEPISAPFWTRYGNSTSVIRFSDGHPVALRRSDIDSTNCTVTEFVESGNYSPITDSHHSGIDLVQPSDIYQMRSSVEGVNSVELVVLVYPSNGLHYRITCQKFARNSQLNLFTMPELSRIFGAEGAHPRIFHQGAIRASVSQPAQHQQIPRANPSSYPTMDAGVPGSASAAQ